MYDPYGAVEAEAPVPFMVPPPPPSMPYLYPDMAMPSMPPFGMYSGVGMPPPGMFPMDDQTPLLRAWSYGGASSNDYRRRAGAGLAVGKVRSASMVRSKSSTGGKKVKPNGKKEGKSDPTIKWGEALYTGCKDDVALMQLLEDIETPAGRAAIMPNLLQVVGDLACHVRGSKVLVVLFDVGDAEQKRLLVGALVPVMLHVTNDAHGCRVVQKAMDFASPEDLVRMAGAMEKDVMSCIESMYGNYVIQKIIDVMPPESCSFIIRAVQTEPAEIASHMYGCRVVQRLLEHCKLGQMSEIIEGIIEDTARLSQDFFGKNVIRHVLQYGSADHVKRVMRVITEDVVSYSNNRCSNGLVDKCLEVSTIGNHAQELQAERSALMQELLGDISSASPPFQQIMGDRFGSLVVQRLFDHARGSERGQLLRHLHGAEVLLRGTERGDQILALMRAEQAATS
uniref:PUM-HD domain-containing protein n=1 Tax=Zooxanthella nutricula TaxID=1333877 RepID=A0A7S2PE12_9DINO